MCKVYYCVLYSRVKCIHCVLCSRVKCIYCVLYLRVKCIYCVLCSRRVRLLEEGKLMEAESQKQLLEQMQRSRLKQLSDRKVEYSPQWFT